MCRTCNERRPLCLLRNFINILYCSSRKRLLSTTNHTHTHPHTHTHISTIRHKGLGWFSEQRINIILCVKLGNDSSDAYEVLSETYRGEAVKGQVFLSGISGSNDVRMSKSRMEAVLITFFDIKDVVRFEFIPQDQTVNQAYYVEISKRLCEAVHRKGPEPWPYERLDSPQ